MSSGQDNPKNLQMPSHTIPTECSNVDVPGKGVQVIEPLSISVLCKEHIVESEL